MDELTLNAVKENIDPITEFVNEKLKQLNCPMKIMAQFDVAIDEIVSNIANYAYHPEVGEVSVRIEVEEDPPAVIITFIDRGKPFDPMELRDPDIDAPADEREIGGLGVYLVKKSMDGIVYTYENGKNILRIRKNI